MVMPDLFLVGAPRSGTTSLYTYLKQHPEIYLSVLKEPHYWSRDLSRPPQAVTDEDLYLGLFAAAGDARWVGEGSVWYLHSAAAARGIAEASPAARILVMLRRPVDMMFSLHGLYTRTGNEDLPAFEDALAAEEERRRGERIPAAAYFPEGLLYTEAARFSPSLRRYLEHFGRDRVHVVLFDDFVADTPRAFNRVAEFLGVDPNFVPEFDLEKANRLIRPKVLEQLRRTPPEVRAPMRGGGRRHTVARREKPSPELRRRLNKHFADDIAELAELLGRDLSFWTEP